MAETYQIYDYRKMPINLIATLTAGLRPDSRVAMCVSGTKVPTDLIIQASIADYLSLIWWSKTKDGQKGRNKPKLITKSLLNEEDSDYVAFNSPEEFMAARERILKGEK